MAVLPVAAAGVSEDGDLMGSQCETRGHAPQEACDPDRGFGKRKENCGPSPELGMSSANGSARDKLLSAVPIGKVRRR